MLTTKDIMETCWEVDALYTEVVTDCQARGVGIPSEDEYSAYCDMKNDMIEDWYDSSGNSYPVGCFDAAGHFYGERAADFSDYLDMER